MTDKTWLKKMEKGEISTEELFDKLRYFGCDPYYYGLWGPVINEVEKRFKELENKKQ